MATIDSYSSHLALAVARPVKARRYVASIRETLTHDLAPGERARLDDAMRGLLDGLRVHGPVCTDCGRDLKRKSSVERGRGDTCAHKAERRAS